MGGGEILTTPSLLSLIPCRGFLQAEPRKMSEGTLVPTGQPPSTGHSGKGGGILEQMESSSPQGGFVGKKEFFPTLRIIYFPISTMGPR